MTPRRSTDFDVIVVGSGVAGLSVAVPLAATRRVAVISAGRLGGGSTALAQGGIAAALAAADSPLLHASDTVAAGAGLCDGDAVRDMTEDAPARVRDLAAVGAGFDLDARGEFALTREGGHRCSRVAHAGGDATGAEVSRALVAALRRTAATAFELTHVLDLRLGQGRHGRQVAGVLVRRPAGPDAGEVVTAREVVLATGGVGGLYDASTNPVDVTGEGLALALRAGAALADLEFVQFHPTGFRVAAGERVPLISEALRGEGAILLDRSGTPIMVGHHPMADLAPRDVVARRIVEVMADPIDGRTNFVGLDATGFGRGVMRSRFPTANRICQRHGIDPATTPIPIVPTQHFLCGGVRTDGWGRTDIAGLCAVGEVAATGVHGANRLASNSMLEGLAYGRRVADRLSRELPEPVTSFLLPSWPLPAVGDDALPQVRAAMSRHAGVNRDGIGLATAIEWLDALVGAAEPAYGAAHRWLVARAILAAATARQESRGCHWRTDFPQPDEAWRHRLLVALDDDGVPVVGAAVPLEQSA
jgi:L-aspartate oxidase